MRIFERLRGRGRRGTNIEIRLLEAITGDLLSKLEQGSAHPVISESNAACGSCPSADETAH
jgi:hypothetical protein